MKLIEDKKEKILSKIGESGLSDLIEIINSNNGTILNSYMDSIKKF